MISSTIIDKQKAVEAPKKKVVENEGNCKHVYIYVYIHLHVLDIDMHNIYVYIYISIHVCIYVSCRST
jgi:hypothetical protein